MSLPSAVCHRMTLCDVMLAKIGSGLELRISLLYGPVFILTVTAEWRKGRTWSRDKTAKWETARNWCFEGTYIHTYVCAYVYIHMYVCTYICYLFPAWNLHQRSHGSNVAVFAAEVCVGQFTAWSPNTNIRTYNAIPYVYALIFSTWSYRWSWLKLIFALLYLWTAMFCHCTRAWSKFLQVYSFTDGWKSTKNAKV